MWRPGFQIAVDGEVPEWQSAGLQRSACVEKVRQNDTAEAETGSFQQSTAGKSECPEFGEKVSLCHGVFSPSYSQSNRVAQMAIWVFLSSGARGRCAAVSSVNRPTLTKLSGKLQKNFSVG